MTVVGIRRVDIDRDGANIHGYKYFCTEKVDGVPAVSYFFSSTPSAHFANSILLA